ncbi:hypothetical protein [Psychrobacter sp. JCM 18900]|uniref:hypothetical protein n=1 Tax=Psychrobacter sp. JCM 18900 TaxID=1298608 RepID=UPI0021C2AABA|nr:hypothetical protein [Psychrobacter sp. JCM 18900]
MDDANLLMRNQGDRKAYKSPKTLFLERDPFYAVTGNILSYDINRTTGTVETNGTDHTTKELKTVPSIKVLLGQVGQSKYKPANLSHSSQALKSTGTATNPVIRVAVPLSQVSHTEKAVTAANVISEPDNEIPPFGRIANY